MNEVKIQGKTCKALKIKGQIIPDYFVSPSGDIWSGKSGTHWKKMTPHISKSTKGYAKTVIATSDGSKINTYFHKAVCETLVPFPRPAGIIKKLWDVTPEAVKQHIQDLYFVNHIDHDRGNYHPSNLEWVTSQENAMAYQAHRKATQ